MPTQRAVGMAPGTRRVRGFAEFWEIVVSRASDRGPGLRDSTLPVLGAVAHAIATGVWIKDLGITAEKILKAIQEIRGTGESTFV